MTRTDLLIAISFTCIIISNAKAQSISIGKKDISEINQFVDSLASLDKFSGTLLIAKGDNILLEKAVGLSDKEQDIKNDMDTKFNLASMGKMLTGVAIAQLVEKGKLLYSDRVVKYLAYLPQNTFGAITIEELLTHTSGLGDIFDNPLFFVIKDTAKTIRDYVNLCLDEPLLFTPGTKVQYSNYGYILLGALIEKISGKSYYDYVNENIFIPAGMTNTGYFETDKTNLHLAIGYALPPMGSPNQQANNELKTASRESNRHMLEVKGTSAGGVYSTVHDLNKLSMALLNSKLISKNSFITISMGRVPVPKRQAPPNVKPLPELKFGYGFGEFYLNKVRIIGHNGGAPGVETQMDIYPDLGYTVIILANYDWVVRPVINLIEDILTTAR